MKQEWGIIDMEEIILDFSGIRTLWNLHEYFKKKFNLPDYYGHNMDALWDCLHCSFQSPTIIILKNIDKFPAEMHEAVETMLQLFYDLEETDEEVTIKTVSTDESSDTNAYLI